MHFHLIKEIKRERKNLKNKYDQPGRNPLDLLNPLATVSFY